MIEGVDFSSTNILKMFSCNDINCNNNNNNCNHDNSNENNNFIVLETFGINL